jgi:hypothetical protein
MLSPGLTSAGSWASTVKDDLPLAGAFTTLGDFRLTLENSMGD